MRAVGTVFAGLVILVGLLLLTAFMVHVYRVASEALHEQQMLYEKARYIAEHASITGSTIALPEPADLIIIDPGGVPHVAKDVQALTLPWSASETKIYVAKRGQLRVGATDPVANSIAALASVAAVPVTNNSVGANANTNCSWYLDPYIYNITHSPVQYRGYIVYRKMVPVGYFFYITPKYRLCDPGYVTTLMKYPIGILYNLGVNVSALLANCPSVYVWDIAAVPDVGALVLTNNGYYYIVYYNGSWKELGGPWSYYGSVGDVVISADRSGSYTWTLEVNVTTNYMNVTYVRTKEFLASYNKLWVRVSMEPGYILAARCWDTVYLYYTTLAAFQSPPLITDSLSAFDEGPDYTWGLQAVAILSPDAYIYKHC